MRSSGSATVTGIYVADAGGLPVSSLSEVAVAVGRGLAGDRYATGKGEWSYDARLCNDVTLIATEALEEVLDEGGPDLRAGRHRRNLETVGVDVLSLVGKRFRIGAVELRGDRPCHPCRYLDGVTGSPAMAALTDRGGLRATVLVGGTLRLGDLLAVEG